MGPVEQEGMGVAVSPRVKRRLGVAWVLCRGRRSSITDLRCEEHHHLRDDGSLRCFN